MSQPTDTAEESQTVELEDSDAYEAYIGEPLDPDYLTKLNEESD